MSGSTVTAETSTSEARIAKAFGLTGSAWMRHANPWSVWTRFSCLSLVALAIWSRTWIGWYSVVAVVAAVVWMIINPRLFGVPASTRNWASKGVFGERVWSERRTASVPAQFDSIVPKMANLLGCIGLAMLVPGLVTFDLWLVVAGIVIVHLAKLWYLDRMVLLFEDVKATRPDVAAWEYGS